jgi:GWxTD domain-containing protein
MKRIRLLIVAAIAALSAVSGFAALSPAKADWAKGPVQFLMTKDEVAQWNGLQSDADADTFIALFWARRDPTPGTPRNEFREDFEARAAYADKAFAAPRVRGSLTDRGKALIIFGAPTKVYHSGGAASQMPQPSVTDTALGNDQGNETFTWSYEGDTAQRRFGLPKAELRFVDRLNTGDFRMEIPRFDYSAAQQRIIAAEITQPNLTSVPKVQTQTVTVPMPITPRAPVAPSTTLKTAAFETAVTEAKSAKANPKGAMITYVEFVSPTGEYYVPVSLTVRGSAGLNPEAADTVFGVVEDASGKRVAAFEEPAKLTASKSDFFYDRTIDLPAGKYTVALGLGKGTTPVFVVTSPLEVAAVSNTATGVSKLILSNNIHEAPEAAPVKSPFAFGHLKIVPTAIFSNKDDLDYFVEIHNPGIDPATNLPKLQMKIDLSDGKGRTLSAPLADMPALPLSGQPGPGQYGIIGTATGGGIPLAQVTPPLAPGDYTLKLKIVDTVAKQSYTLEQKFKITG